MNMAMQQSMNQMAQFMGPNAPFSFSAAHDSGLPTLPMPSPAGSSTIMPTIPLKGQDASVLPKPDYECMNAEARMPGIRRKYCPHEVTALVMGVQRYADDSCPWSCILHDPDLGGQFHGRSGVDLKDKWRTLMKNRPELASFMENRKNNRQYRPFNQEEEQALIEGVRRYSGERNIWSMILDDDKLGPRFNQRSNVQLKDKFRTMKRAGQIIEVPPAKGARSMSRTVSGRKPSIAKSSAMKKVKSNMKQSPMPSSDLSSTMPLSAMSSHGSSSLHHTTGPMSLSMGLPIEATLEDLNSTNIKSSSKPSGPVIVCNV